MLCLSVRPGAVRAVSEAGGDHAGRADDCSRGAAAAGRGPRLPVLEGPAGSRSCTTDTLPQLRVRVCVYLLPCAYCMCVILLSSTFVLFFSEKLRQEVIAT